MPIPPRALETFALRASAETATPATRELTLVLGGTAVPARLAAPTAPASWIVLATSRPADRPQAAAAARALHRLGVGVLTVDLAHALGDQEASARAVRDARTWLATEHGVETAIALGGAGFGAPAALAAASGATSNVPAVIAWNGRFAGRAAAEPLAAPALLLLDRAQPWRERRVQRRLARALGTPSAFVVARGLDRHGDLLVRDWQSGSLTPAPSAARRTALAPAVRRGAAAGLVVAAAVGVGVPAAAAEKPSRFAAGKVVSPARVAGDGFAAAGTVVTPAPAAPRPGKTVTRDAIAGDNTGRPTVFATGSQGLIDSAGLKWFVNTNITFSTTSSASGGMSEASFTHPIVASTLNGGTTTQTLNDAFDGYNSLAVHVGAGAPAQPAQPQTGNPAFTMFNKNGPATLECDGRQVVLPNQAVAGDVTVSRKVYVPSDASYARWMDVVTNTGTAPQTVSLYVANNLGSDNNTRVFDTSSGDTTADANDLWVGSFQNFSGTTSSDPRLGHVLQGEHARTPLGGVNFVDGDDNPYWGYDVTLAPGETKIVLNYAVAKGTKAEVVAAATQIAAQPPIGCMTAAEQAAVVNFKLDQTAPVLNLPAPITAAATGPAGAPVTFDATATDAVDGTVAVSCAPPSGSTFAIGTTTVTCTATDAAGNTSTGTFTVAVTDTTAPVLTLPAPITVKATGPSGAPVSFTASATDVVDGAVTPVCVPASGSTFTVGTTTVTCTAKDAAGNTSTGTFTVTVTDTTAPVLTLPKTITLATSSSKGRRVTFKATATDAGASVPVTCSPKSGSTFRIGTTTVTCTAKDAAGNTSTGTFKVVVRQAALRLNGVKATPSAIRVHEGAAAKLDIRSTINDGALVTYAIQRRTANGWTTVKTYRRKNAKGQTHAIVRLVSGSPAASGASSAAASVVLGTLPVVTGDYRVQVTAVRGKTKLSRTTAFTVRAPRAARFTG